MSSTDPNDFQPTVNLILTAICERAANSQTNQLYLVFDSYFKFQSEKSRSAIFPQKETNVRNKFPIKKKI